MNHKYPLVIAFFILACPSCGQTSVELATVSGRVTYQGKPVTTGTIMFQPEKGRPATGRIGPDGSYTLTTSDPGDGAAVGRHRVTIDAWRPAGDSPDAAIVWIVPEIYSETTTSPLTAEVKDGPNTINFDLPVNNP